MGIANDVLAKDDSEINHDIMVLSLHETAQNNNLKFNPDRIQFKRRDCRFLWKLLTQEGMSVDQKKVDATRQMDTMQ